MWNKQWIVKGKNAKCEHKNRMILIRRTRAKIGKSTGFTFSDKPFSDAKLNRYIAEKMLNEVDLTAEGHCAGGNSLLLMWPQLLVSS